MRITIPYEKGHHMICPSCSQTATSFLRNAFTLQGVSFLQSVKGYFKCQKCGTLLRITSFGKIFWVFFAGTAISLALFVSFYQRLLSSVGIGITAMIWMFLVITLMFIFTFCLWKFAHAEKVDSDVSLNTPPPHSTP
jgi:hypothetical protein